jgi:hypothetical protein
MVRVEMTFLLLDPTPAARKWRVDHRWISSSKAFVIMSVATTGFDFGWDFHDRDLSIQIKVKQRTSSLLANPIS